MRRRISGGGGGGEHTDAAHDERSAEPQLGPRHLPGVGQAQDAEDGGEGDGAGEAGDVFPEVDAHVGLEDGHDCGGGLTASSRGEETVN